MKATLEFNIPEESNEHLIAVRSGDLATEMQHSWEQVRSWLKHGHTFKTPDEALESVRELLRDGFMISLGEDA